jgi:streptogramin lyase
MDTPTLFGRRGLGGRADGSSPRPGKWLVFVALLLAGQGASAQPGRIDLRSLEVRMAEATCVVRGTIGNLKRAEVVPPGGLVRYEVTVAIEEVLKGSPRQVFGLVRETSGRDETYDQWFRRQTSFLWFIGPHENTDSRQGNEEAQTNGWDFFPLSEPVKSTYSREGFVYFMDLTCHTNAAEILARARRYAARKVEFPRSHTFTLPPSGVYAFTLRVPVEPFLETIAQKLVRSPEDFFPEKRGGALTDEERNLLEIWRKRLAEAKTDAERRQVETNQVRFLQHQRNALRAEGVKALQYFKSAENISLLKSALDDPMEVLTEIRAGERIGTIIKQFPTRASAFETLKGWGVVLPEPVLEDPVPPRKAEADDWQGNNRPASVAVDREGNLFVANVGNSVIRKLTPDGTNWTVRIIDGADNAEGAWFQEGRSCSLAVDLWGHVYVADCFRCIVRKLKRVGTNWIGSTIAGRVGEKGRADGLGGEARFNEPSAVAVDKHGRVYVADASDSTIRQLTPEGADWLVTTIAGTPLKQGWWAPTNRAERISHPRGLAVDNWGNIYVASSSDNDIKKLQWGTTNWVVSAIPGARFQYPSAVAVDSDGGVFVAYWAFGNTPLCQLTPAGDDWRVNTIGGEEERAGNPLAGAPAPRFSFPRGLAVDGAGNIYVANTAASDLRKITRLGEQWVVTTIMPPARKNRP